jgi:O-acetyl-ADP-ribose deacetylase (regulator of RNase III)
MAALPHVTFHAGDILSAATQVLVSTANPGFQLTGGIGALLLGRGGAAFQQELNSLARARFGTKPAPRGSLLTSSPAGLPFAAIVHVVAIDVFYKTDESVIAKCLEDTLLHAESLAAPSIAVPAFATGYGRHPLESCGAAMRRGFETVAGRLATLAQVEIWLRDDRRREAFEAGWNAR